MIRWAKLAWLLPLFLIAGCHGFFVDSKALVSLAVTPANSTILPSKTQQMTATGTFGDGSTKDISTSVTWTSSNTAVVTVSATGLVTTLTVGSATIAAKQGSTSGSSSLTVATVVINSITVSPGNTSIRAGQTQQYAATATMSDGSTRDVTSQVTWASSNTNVATISSTGLATAVTAGSTNISAASGNITNSTPLTVTAF